jgi:hypothetical protein
MPADQAQKGNTYFIDSKSAAEMERLTHQEGTIHDPFSQLKK